MIRYDITLDELNRRIDEKKPSWRGRASERTEKFREEGAYNEELQGCSKIWNEIKAVYMGLQHDKCGYCERKFENEEYGAIEHDVEHFRPKKAVDAYPPPGEPQYLFPTGGVWTQGYYLLAYHPQNYLASCKVCNTILKKTYFPIAGTRQQNDDPRQLLSENPFLIYPIGTLDDDPEDLINFDGIIPKSCGSTAHDKRRAKVTIDLLNLNRESLWRERALVITMLWSALTRFRQNTISQNFIASAIQPGAAHCNCARSFCRLYQNDPARARYLAEYTAVYLKENSG